MQVAGKVCTTCAQRVSSILEGRGCAACELAFHRDCLEDEDVCPSCSVAFVVQDARVEHREHAEEMVLARKGDAGEQRFAVGAILAVILVDAVLLVNSTPLDSPRPPWSGALLLAVGLYFVVCSMRFRTFFLYRLKVARAVRWYGEAAAHFLYLLLGLFAVSASLFMLLGRAPW
jgi:hypothetical protein